MLEVSEVVPEVSGRGQSFKAEITRFIKGCVNRPQGRFVRVLKKASNNYVLVLAEGKFLEMVTDYWPCYAVLGGNMMGKYHRSALAAGSTNCTNLERIAYIAADLAQDTQSFLVGGPS